MKDNKTYRINDIYKKCNIDPNASFKMRTTINNGTLNNKLASSLENKKTTIKLCGHTV